MIHKVPTVCDSRGYSEPGALASGVCPLYTYVHTHVYTSKHVQVRVRTHTHTYTG